MVREELVGRRESAHPSVQPWNLWRGVCTQGWEAEKRVRVLVRGIERVCTQGK